MSWEHLTTFEQQMLLGEAIYCYRQRKEGATYPAGTCNGYWEPALGERQTCCYQVSPSARFPHRLEAHCLTVEHVGLLHGVDVAAMRKFIRRRLGKDPMVTFYLELRDRSDLTHDEAERTVRAALQ